jgi:hypothetical protein
MGHVESEAVGPTVAPGWFTICVGRGDDRHVGGDICRGSGWWQRRRGVTDQGCIQGKFDCNESGLCVDKDGGLGGGTG